MSEAPIQIFGPAGLVVGFWVLLAVTGGIGFAAALLIASAPRRLPALSRMRFVRTTAVVVGAGLFVLLFGWIFLSGFAGFHALALGDEGAVLHYALPPRQVAVTWSEVGEVRRERSYRGQWRLVFYGTHGARRESVSGGYRDVKRAWLEVRGALKKADPEVIEEGDALVRGL